MPISFFLDTNALISLSGLDSKSLSYLSDAIANNRILLYISHVQIDEKCNQEFINYRHKIEKALINLKNIGIDIKCTVLSVSDVSRYGYAKFGSEEIEQIYEALKREIEKCSCNKRKDSLNIARDALIALSSLDYDFFITGDNCLKRSWKTVIELNKENKKLIEQKHKVPKITCGKSPTGVFEAIMNNSSL